MNSHRNANFIAELEIDETELYKHEETELKDGIVRFYGKLYKETVDWRLRIDGLHFTSIDEEDRGWLERSFDKYYINHEFKRCFLEKVKEQDDTM